MSNFAWMQVALVGFCALPIAVCLARACGPRWFGARFAVCVVSLLGWVISNFATQFYFGDLDDHLRDETGRFINRLADESGWLGGVYALIYYAPFALDCYNGEHRAKQRSRTKQLTSSRNIPSRAAKFRGNLMKNQIRLSLLLLGVAALAPALMATQIAQARPANVAVHTPKPGSRERSAIMDALRVPV